MSDLFDHVKSAPPPDNVPPSLQQINKSPLEVLALSPQNSPIFINELVNDLVITTPKSLPKQPIIRLRRLSLQESNDDNKSDKESAKSSFTKTKAQQKQFDDELPQSSGGKKKTNTVLTTNVEHKISHSLSGQIKKCCVFLKRLTEEEICIHTHLIKVDWNRSKIKSDTLEVSPKRTVHKKSNRSDNSFQKFTLSKKNKPVGSSTPIHFKILPPKLRKVGAIKKRIMTHAPIFNTPKHRCELPSGELIREFGVRVFRSYVRVKNCKHPSGLAFEASERVRKSRRPNLSVSFREAVEIIGHTGGEGSHCTVPTRLAKVENGEVVQFVGLDQSNYTKMCPISASSGTLLENSKKHRKKRLSSEKFCGPRRGSKSAKPSGYNRTLPLSDMARLCINDDDITSGNDGTAEEEYIVPIDLSGPRKVMKDEASSSRTIQENKNDQQKPASRDVLKLLPSSLKPVEIESYRSGNCSPHPLSTENQNTKNDSNQSTKVTEESNNIKCITSSFRQLLKQPTLGNLAASTKEQNDSMRQETLHIDTTKIYETANVTICSPIKEILKLRCRSEESDISSRSANDNLSDDANCGKKKLNSPPPTTLIQPKTQSPNMNNIDKDILAHELTVLNKCDTPLDKTRFLSPEFVLSGNNSFTLSDETTSINAAHFNDSRQLKSSANAAIVNLYKATAAINYITSPLTSLPSTDNLTELNSISTKKTVEDKISLTKTSKPNSTILIHDDSNLNELGGTLNLQGEATDNSSLELRREGNLVEDIIKEDP